MVELCEVRAAWNRVMGIQHGVIRMSQGPDNCVLTRTVRLMSSGREYRRGLILSIYSHHMH